MTERVLFLELVMGFGNERKFITGIFGGIILSTQKSAIKNCTISHMP